MKTATFRNLLEQQEKVLLHEEIARYAAYSADTADDLDESLETAALEHLRDTEKHQW
ncbi:MAG: hypothetical protein NDI77_15170 [Geobacteraceae bacterium]|nr:hypothetical protein [Geobacteraceae bacterium]